VTARPIDDLVAIVRHGGGLDIVAEHFTTQYLVRLVRNMRKDGTVVVIA
jgi:hypothetical protein